MAMVQAVKNSSARSVSLSTPPRTAGNFESFFHPGDMTGTGVCGGSGHSREEASATARDDEAIIPLPFFK